MPSNYNFGDRLLHRLVLDFPFVSEISFDLDALFFKKKSAPLNEKHVFICGLARAGTTILMRSFYSTGQFRSLTYRDMPFVLMPGVWQKLSKVFHRQEEAKERAHSDGILVDFDSPEAFEEVFWRIFSDDDYVFENCLRPHSVSNEIIDRFRGYVRRVVDCPYDRNQRRYLSKNNNNILRLGSIRKAFPNALIVIPYRDPIQQAISLLYQHKKFCEMHAIDRFAYDYMGWLGHYEFGATHKPFVFEKANTLSSTEFPQDDINYWLNIWINTYRYLYRISPLDSCFICFEDLCEFPAKNLKELFRLAELEIDENRLNDSFKLPVAKDIDNVNESIKVQAQKLYQDLKSRPFPSTASSQGKTWIGNRRYSSTKD